MKKGDIILVRFPFTDLEGSKLRPALVLVKLQLDIVVSFITTQIKWKEETDILLLPSDENGLKKESLLRLSKLATLDIDLAIGKLGSLDNIHFNSLNNNLKTIFQLKS